MHNPLYQFVPEQKTFSKSPGSAQKIWNIIMRQSVDVFRLINIQEIICPYFKCLYAYRQFSDHISHYLELP